MRFFDGLGPDHPVLATTCGAWRLASMILRKPARSSILTETTIPEGYPVKYAFGDFVARVRSYFYPTLRSNEKTQREVSPFAHRPRSRTNVG